MHPSLLRCCRLAVAGAILLAGGRAWPQVDFVEQALGASNVQATTGNGRLTAGISRDGDLTVLSWPSPSYWDQLHYLSGNGPGARDRTRMGALRGMGAFAGLVISRDGGTTLEVTWLGEDPWTREVAFTGADTQVVRTTFHHASLALSVAQTDLVLTEHDVLVRRYEIRREAGSAVTDAWLLGYANLSPGVSRVDQIPLADFLADHRNDFLAAWDATRTALIHFHPADTGVMETLFAAFANPPQRDFGPVGDLLKQSAVDGTALQSLLDDLDNHYAPGVYAMLGASPAPDQVQVGEDATDTCAAVAGWADGLAALAATVPEGALPVDPSALGLVRCGDWDPVASVRAEQGWQATPEDALADTADGVLSGSRLAGAQANTALRIPLSFAADVAHATLYFAFGSTAAGAATALGAVRGEDPAALQARVEAADRAYVASLNLPQQVSTALRELCIRALLNLRVGTDRETGAIVASINRQPSYQLDWPRDGAFFNAALDVAGRHDLVTRRLDLYASWMRRERVAPVPLLNQPVPGWPDCPSCTDLPPGTWEMNYYPDGRVGGNIRLEIDNTALLVWSFVSHAGYLAEPERTTYLGRVWPTVKQAADFLAGWRDPDTGLVWPANEDDNAPFTQGLQGAGTVFGALRAAAKMARALGDEASASAWSARAAELRQATLTHLYRADVGFLDAPQGGATVNPGSATGGASSWLAWPARFLPWTDPRLREQIRRNLLVQLDKVRGKGEGGSYVTKAAVAAALILPPGPERDQALEIAERLATEIADPRTRYLGEVFRNLDDDGDGIADRRVNAVATPHLWAGVLVYLTAMAYERPDLFDLYETVLPQVAIPLLDARAEGGGGCGCRVGAPGSLPTFWLIALALLVARRRRSEHR